MCYCANTIHPVANHYSHYRDSSPALTLRSNRSIRQLKMTRAQPQSSLPLVPTRSETTSSPLPRRAIVIIIALTLPIILIINVSSIFTQLKLLPPLCTALPLRLHRVVTYHSPESFRPILDPVLCRAAVLQFPPTLSRNVQHLNRCKLALVPAVDK